MTVSCPLTNHALAWSPAVPRWAIYTIFACGVLLILLCCLCICIKCCCKGKKKKRQQKKDENINLKGVNGKTTTALVSLLDQQQM